MATQSEPTPSLFTEMHRVVDLTLRYIAAGGSAILAFGVIQGNDFEFLRAGSAQPDVSGWLILLHVSVLGIAIYAVHRAVLFRLVHIVLFGIVGRFLKHPRGPFQLEKRIRELRIKHRSSQPPHPWSKAFDTWAAECHFLYCSAWGTFLAVALAWLIGPWSTTSSICLSVAVALFVSALVHDGAEAIKILEKLDTET